ncbi:EpsG family protein [Vibrio cholerae]
MLVLIIVLFFIVHAFCFFSNSSRCREASLYTYLSVLIFGLYVFIFFFKSEQFGADTKNYLADFSGFCISPNLYEGIDYSYEYSFKLINFLMLGECNPEWLMWIWAIFIFSILIVIIFFSGVSFIYIVSIVSSFIGVELLTNAMRQGFSIVIFLLAIVFLYKNRLVIHVFFLLLSFAFHQSTILIFGFLLLSKFNYKVFTPLLLLTVTLVFSSSSIDFLTFVLDFKMMILRYIPYSSDDFIIRILGFLNFSLVLFIAKSYIGRESDIISNVIINLFSLSLLCSFVPYFGFRIIYGLFPVFILISVLYFKGKSADYKRYLSLVTVINSFFAIFWLLGSSQMRKIDFMSFL